MSGNLQSRILHLPASMPSETSPLSADVYAIRGETAWWIFDVGASDVAADFVNNLPCDIVVNGGEKVSLKKNVVISHFHADHFVNLPRIQFDKLYVGRETFRHCDATIRARAGVHVVDSPLLFDDGLRIQIEPIPSSHAKGSLMLTVGESAFLGDSTYPTVNHNGPDFYNVQLLYQQIQFLKGCSAQHFVMSHRRFSPREKETVLQLLENFYAMRQSHKNVIEVP
ncbi:MAG: MBL fold metallo-hydrolase [Fibrobacter sp.]|nr:MBL fold metallo-hydrolase [Fibrobacter sp.]